MASAQLQSREEELRQAEERAIQILSAKTPQRRFGFGITKADQQRSLAQKAEARNVLDQIRRERESNQAVANQESTVNQRQADIAKGKKVAQKIVFENDSAAIFSLKNESQREAYRYYSDIYRSGKSRSDRAKAEAEQGLKPIYREGELVGYEDLIRQVTIPVDNLTKVSGNLSQRLEKAGVIEATGGMSVAPQQGVLVERDLLGVKTNNTQKLLASLNISSMTQIEKKTTRDIVTGKPIPVYSVVTSQQTPEGTLIRKPSNKEFADFQKDVKVYTGSTQTFKGTKKLISLSKETYYKTALSDPQLDKDILALNKFLTSKVDKLPTPLTPFKMAKFNVKDLEAKEKFFKDIRSEYISGVLPSNKIDLAIFGATAGVAGIIGGGVRVGATLALKVGPRALTGFKVATGGVLGYQTGKFVKNEATRFYNMDSIYTRAFEGGKLTREIFAFSIGYKLAKPPRLGVGLKDYLMKDIVVYKEPPKKIKFRSDSEIINVRSNEKYIDVAGYKLAGFKPARYSYTVKQYELIFDKFRVINTKTPRTIKELQLRYGTLTKTKIERESLTFSFTEPFLVKNGRVVRALKGNRLPSVITLRGTSLRNARPVVSRLEAVSLKSLSLNNKKTARSLDKNTVASLSTIKNLFGKGSFKVKLDLGETPKVQKGEVITTDLFKIGKKEFVIFRGGRRTYRGDVTTFSKTKALVEYEQKFGLKEVEVISERQAFVDITFPRFKAPRKVNLIKGRTVRKEYELPSAEGFEFTSNTKGLKLKKTSDRKTLKLLQEQIVATAVKQAQYKPIKINVPRAQTTSTTQTGSIYYGKGTYELQDSQPISQRALIKYDSRSQSVGAYGTKTLNIPKQKDLFKSSFGVTNKELYKEITKTTNREVTKTVNKDLTKSLEREVYKTASKSAQKQLNKPLLKQITKMPPKATGYPTITPPRRIPKPGLPKFPQGEKEKSNSSTGGSAFRAYIIRRGKRVYVSGAVPRGLALRTGTEKALKSLSATFGITPVNKRTTSKDIFYQPPKALFRSYRIKKGKQIPLTNVFIQKKGKRLSTRSEVSALQQSRRLFK